MSIDKTGEVFHSEELLTPNQEHAVAYGLAQLQDNPEQAAELAQRVSSDHPETFNRLATGFAYRYPTLGGYNLLMLTITIMLLYLMAASTVMADQGLDGSIDPTSPSDDLFPNWCYDEDFTCTTYADWQAGYLGALLTDGSVVTVDEAAAVTGTDEYQQGLDRLGIDPLPAAPAAASDEPVFTPKETGPDGPTVELVGTPAGVTMTAEQQGNKFTYKIFTVEEFQPDGITPVEYNCVVEMTDTGGNTQSKNETLIMLNGSIDGDFIANGESISLTCP